MPAITDLTINRGTDVTADDVTFPFMELDPNGVPTWHFDVGSTPVSDLIVKIGRSKTANVTRVRVSFAYPVTEEQTNPVRVELHRTLRANVEFILPNDSTSSERRDLLAYMHGLLRVDDASLPITEMVENLEGLF